MSLPEQPAAYSDCYSLYQRALDTPGGVRAMFPAWSDAKYFQLRMHYSRTIQRRANSTIYPPDHHLHNTSEFDSLQVQVREDTAGAWWVYVKPHGANLDVVEPIEEQEETTTDAP